jgi:hypothetical protein
MPAADVLYRVRALVPAVYRQRKGRSRSQDLHKSDFRRLVLEFDYPLHIFSNFFSVVFEVFQGQ